MQLPQHQQTTFQLENASFRVPGRTLLQPLSLSFTPGKVTALIGHNGSGKSTLLKMLGRHHAASEGRVLLNGRPVESLKSKVFAREVAYLPQQLPAAEGMTVRELVAIGRDPRHGALGRLSEEDRARLFDRFYRLDEINAFCLSSGRQLIGWGTATGLAGDDGGAEQPLPAAG